MRQILLGLFLSCMGISFANDINKKIDLNLVFALSEDDKVEEQYFKSQVAAYTYAISQIEKDVRYKDINIKLSTFKVDCNNFDKYLHFLKTNRTSFIINSDSCSTLRTGFYKGFKELNIPAFTFNSLTESSFKEYKNYFLDMFEPLEKQVDVMFDFLIQNKWDNFLVVKSKTVNPYKLTLIERLKAAKKTVYELDFDPDSFKGASEDNLFVNWNPKIESIIWLGGDGASFINFERALNKKGLSKNEKILGHHALCTNDIVTRSTGSNIYCTASLAYDVPDADANAVDLLKAINKSRAFHPVVINSRVIRTYIIPFLIADAALKIQSSNGQLLREEITSHKWQTVMGEVGFSQNGFFDKSPTVIKHVNHGKQFNIVYPEKYINTFEK